MLFSHSERSPSLLLPPNHLLFALNVSRLIVGLIHDPVVMFEEDNEVSPLKTFLPTTPAPTAVRQMYANPGNIPELVAILRQMSAQIASWESSMYRPCRHAKMLRQATRRLKKSLAVRTEPLLNKQDANAWPAGRLTRYKGMMQTVTSPRVEGAWAEGYSQYL